MFLLHGLRHGFDIIDTENIDNASPVEMDNYPRTIAPPMKPRVEAKLVQEIAEGNYIPVTERPTIISALTALEKPDGGIRLIHDFSRPEGTSVNSYASKEPCAYQTVDDALSTIQPGWWMGKVDLLSAFRSVGTNPDHHTFAGLKWQFGGTDETVYLIDSRLPQGARKSPAHFNRITQAVKRMMIRRGFKATVVLLDDFFVAAPTFHQCRIILNALITLLRSLGFSIHWGKITGPSQSCLFLGILIDSVQGNITLDPKKTKEFCLLLTETLQRTRLSKHQLQKLAGKLNWAANVIPWGRTQIGPIFQALRGLKLPGHKARIEHCKPVLAWWLTCLQLGNNTRPIWDTRTAVDLSCDASQQSGGAFCQGDWMYCNWLADWPAMAGQHINIKELAMIEQSVARWAPCYPGHKLCIQTDNMAAMAMTNKGSTSHPVAATLLQSMALTALTYNVTVQTIYLPGKDNEMADSISRLQSPGQLQRFVSLLNCWYQTARVPQPTLCFLPWHMTYASLDYLLFQVLKLWDLLASWTRRSPPYAHTSLPAPPRPPTIPTGTPI